MPERQALLEAAERLEAATRELGEKFEAVDVFAHDTAKAHNRTRDLTYIVTAAVLIELVLIVVLAFALNRVDDANDRSVRNTEYAVDNCLLANDTRAKQRELWATVLKLSDDPDDTAQDRAEAETFRAYVNDTFADRDCSKVTEGKAK